MYIESHHQCAIIMTTKTNTYPQGFDTKIIVDIGQIVFFDKFVLLDLNEGTHFGFNEILKIHSIVSDYYTDRSYAYIFNRDVSYSVNPIAYDTLNANAQLKCIAIVKQFSNSHDIEVEKHFIKKPFEVHTYFGEAVEWVNLFV